METRYLLQGKLTAKPGHRQALGQILLEASSIVANARGCKLYLVGIDQDDPNSIFVTELWDTKDDHDNSLKMESVRTLIMKAMPLLDGPPTKGQELKVLGGTGV